jgi:predicted transcriptional regulator YdeE
LNRLLSFIFPHPMEGVVPEIVQLPDEILVAGVAMETNTRSIQRDIPRLAKELESCKQGPPVPDRREPWAFIAASWDYDEESGAFRYMMGDVVTSVTRLPQGLQPFRVPAVTYAVFPIRPRNRFGWGVAIASAKEYIYGTWMKTSEFEPGGVIDDFEYHDERSTRKKAPEIELYVCIKPRRR